MTAPRYIEHLTLTTGHTRRCWREEVADDVLELLRPLIARAVESVGQTPVPGDLTPRCTFTAVHGRARALYVTVSAVADGPGFVPLVTMVVAPNSLAAADARRVLVPGDGEEQIPTPAAPCCLVNVHDTAALWPEAMNWLGDFERCLAWAWIDGGQQ